MIQRENNLENIKKILNQIEENKILESSCGIKDIENEKGKLCYIDFQALILIDAKQQTEER